MWIRHATNMLNVNTCAVHAGSKVFSIKYWISKKNRVNEQSLNMFCNHGSHDLLKNFPWDNWSAPERSTMFYHCSNLWTRPETGSTYFQGKIFGISVQSLVLLKKWFKSHPLLYPFFWYCCRNALRDYNECLFFRIIKTLVITIDVC